jgi:hypothetical protein
VLIPHLTPLGVEIVDLLLPNTGGVEFILLVLHLTPAQCYERSTPTGVILTPSSVLQIIGVTSYTNAWVIAFDLNVVFLK